MTYEEARKKYTEDEDILRHLFESADESTYRRLVEIIVQSNFLKYFLDKLYFFEEIPEDVSDLQKKVLTESDKENYSKEKMVALNSYDYVYDGVEQLHPQIFVSPECYLSGYNGSIGEIYVRESTLDYLLECLSILPTGYGIKVFDGYRTVECQKVFYNRVLSDKLAEELDNYDNRNMSTEQIKQHVIKDIMPKYVVFPTEERTAPHNTGGSVDCRICDKNGVDLNYGCQYNEYSDAASLNYFEEKLKKGIKLDNYQMEALLNRRVSANIFRHISENDKVKSAININSISSFAKENWHLENYNKEDKTVFASSYNKFNQDDLSNESTCTINEYLEEK